MEMTLSTESKMTMPPEPKMKIQHVALSPESKMKIALAP